MEFLSATCEICEQEDENVVFTNDPRYNFRYILSFLISNSASAQVGQIYKLPQAICLTCKQQMLRSYRFLKQTEFLKLNKSNLKKADKSEAIISQFCNTNYTVGIGEEIELNGEGEWIKNCDIKEEEGSLSPIEGLNPIEGFSEEEGRSPIEDQQFVDVKEEIIDNGVSKFESIEEVTGSSSFQYPSLDLQTFSKSRFNSLLPKSRISYEKAYADFEKWCKKMNYLSISENAVLDFFTQLRTKYTANCMFILFRKIKLCLGMYYGVDISTFSRLQNLLAQWSREKIFSKKKTKDDINRFIFLTDDSTCLAMKVILILKYCGACKHHLLKINTDDIQYTENKIIVTMTRSNLPRVFEITERVWINVIRHYAALRPQTVRHKKFLLRYSNGHCSTSAIGIKTLERLYNGIDAFFKLPHSSNIDPVFLKRHESSTMDECQKKILQKRIKACKAYTQLHQHSTPKLP